jgi:arylsulfatase A-like enzyme
MSDLTESLIPKLREHRLPGLNLGSELIFPNYDGYSILNLPASLCHWLGAAPLPGAPLLAPEILAHVGEGYRQVVFVLVDALALHRLQRWMTGTIWETLAAEGLLAPLTSVTPSTTSAALTSLWTGHSPAQHGVTGYEMWLKEYGIVANTILHAPISYEGDVGSLVKAGFEPERFLSQATLGMHLADHGVQVQSFQHTSITSSGLSRMFFQKVTMRSFSTPADLWINLRQQVEKSGGRFLASAYWGMVDGLSHRYGPDDERTEAEFIQFSQAFERLFVQRLSPAARRDTLVVLSADHGQIATHPDSHYDLRYHPGLARRLHILPTGEHRLAYLYVKPGQVEAVREYIESTWPNQFYILDAPYAVEAGLFGPGKPHPSLLDRVGDLILVARGRAYLWWADKDDQLMGRHGGLHPQEMLVPLVAASLA